jgi:hypothetical protein
LRLHDGVIGVCDGILGPAPRGRLVGIRNRILGATPRGPPGWRSLVVARPQAKRDLGLGSCKPRPGSIVGEPDQRLTGKYLVVDLDQHLRDHIHDGRRDLDRSRGGLDPAGGHRLPALVIRSLSSSRASRILRARSRRQHSQRDHGNCAEGG